jgi:hypothetical protein
MIKFFRKIRYDLMEKNKTGKYFKYAIGEIILVVIGILIALQINNWNEFRKQNTAEKEFIDGIKFDLTQDKEFIKLIIERAEEKNSIYTILNQELFNYYNSNRLSLDSLLVEYFKAQGTFYPISGSFQSAISGNQISKFKNKNFNNVVTKLYNSTYTRLLDNALEVDNRWSYINKIYSQIRRTGQIPNMSEPELNEFHNDIFYHIQALNYYRGNLSKAVIEIDKLLKQ